MSSVSKIFPKTEGNKADNRKTHEKVLLVGGFFDTLNSRQSFDCLLL